MSIDPSLTNVSPIEENGNLLFPVFFKLEKLRLLIVGGGYVGLEKLNAVLQNSPGATVRVVGITISEAIKQRVAGFQKITLIEKTFEPGDLEGTDLVIIAINDKQVSSEIQAACKRKGLLVNVADTPDLCDFYLGSVVKKGNLKIAISTNGKSPTVAKRVKEVINDLIPEEIDELLDNIQKIRATMTGDFEAKVRQLNALTKSLAEKDIKID